MLLAGSRLMDEAVAQAMHIQLWRDSVHICMHMRLDPLPDLTTLDQQHGYRSAGLVHAEHATTAVC
jgi:hypothetical protein